MNENNKAITTPPTFVNGVTPLNAENLNKLSTAITETKSQLDEKVLYDNVFNSYINASSKVEIPNFLGFKTKLNIKKEGCLFYSTNIEPIDYFPTEIEGKIYYVDGTNGKNSNDGLTKTTALKTPYYAVSKGDAKEIRIMGGVYNKDDAPNNVNNNTIKIIGLQEYGRAMFYGGSPVVWTQHEGNVYKCTRAVTQNVWDITKTDIENNYIPMSKKTSISEVTSNPHSYYFDTATNTVYVRTFDNRQPDNNTIYISLMGSGRARGNGTYYYENIDFFFGTGVTVDITTASDNLIFLAKNCRFNYNSTLNGLTVQGAKLCVLKDCEASFNANDGFNYHEKLAVNGEVIEIGCKAFENGFYDDDGNDNGSTIHESYKAIRIMGEYYNNWGPNIADVNNAQSFNIGCKAYGSKTKIGVNADFYFQKDSILYNCYAGKGSKISAMIGDNAKMYLRSNLFEGTTIGANEEF